MKPITICALTFGDHLDLIQRCLRSVSRALPNEVPIVGEIRIALNACSRCVDDWVSTWAREEYALRGDTALRIRIYRTRENQFKYPIMRRMLRQPARVATPYIMWFDDDSYFETPLPGDFWGRLLSEAANSDMLGQRWLMPLQGNQWEWIKTQPWYNPAVGLPPKRVRGVPAFDFCQGAWWVARAEMLWKYGWPLAEIRHNGGDSLLGELMRHQGLRMSRFISGDGSKHDGVRINADGQGRHSRARRRGHSEKRVGWDYAGRPLDISHQRFEMSVETLPRAG